MAGSLIEKQVNGLIKVGDASIIIETQRGQKGEGNGGSRKGRIRNNHPGRSPVIERDKDKDANKARLSNDAKMACGL